MWCAIKMTKLRFQIKGIRCQSCAFLIEEELKSQNAVLQAKVDFATQKATVIFDETQIGQEEILQSVNRAGDYRAEKIIF